MTKKIKWKNINLRFTKVTLLQVTSSACASVINIYYKNAIEEN